MTNAQNGASSGSHNEQLLAKGTGLEPIRTAVVHPCVVPLRDMKTLVS